jgi:chromosomal replication initiator protein
MLRDEKNENQFAARLDRSTEPRPLRLEADAAQAEIWTHAMQRIRAKVGQEVYSAWFEKLDLWGFENGTVHVTAATKFLQGWITQNYLGIMRQALQSGSADIVAVKVWVRSGQRAPSAKPQATVASARQPTGQPKRVTPEAAPIVPAFATTAGDGLSGSLLDRKLTFRSFMVGKSNAFAHAAAQQASRMSPGELPIYNPLYFHSAVGLGKTHLVQALAHQADEMGRRVVYLTAERFMYSFVAALRSKDGPAFKEQLRGIDMLIIDDLQFLNGKAIQDELCHTLNALIDAGKQVVVAADRPPIDLETFDQRMRTRLVGGLAVEIEALDEALRVQILDARIAAARTYLPTFEVRPEVVVWLARQLTSNGRDLEGAVNRMLAHATLNGQPIDIPTAEIAIRDLIRQKEPKKVKIEDIQRLVASHYNVPKSEILSARRTAAVVKPRQIAMYLSKALTPRSLPEIGRRFGGRDHTTVLHAVRKIENLIGTDQSLAGDIDLLKRMLLE